jgi:hypothetical protein
MLFGGVAALALVAGTALALLVGLVFSAMVNERLREIGDPARGRRHAAPG